MESEHMASRQGVIIVSTTIFLVLAILSHALRLYAKRITAATVRRDDILVGVGLAFSLVTCTSNYVGVLTAPHTPAIFSSLGNDANQALALKYEFGRHTYDVPEVDQRNYVICVPIRGYWDRRIHARCVDEPKLFYAFAVLSLITDNIVLLQPVPMIVKLQRSWQSRLGLCLVFMTGGLVVVFSGIRLGSLKDIKREDILWTNVYPSIWTCAEVTIGVVSANLPLLRPVVTNAWSKTTRFIRSYHGLRVHYRGFIGTRNRERSQSSAPIIDFAAATISTIGNTTDVQHCPRNTAEEYELSTLEPGIVVTREFEVLREQASATE
ncbi:hypothetical protein ACLMJK_001968 [Lecanora helva]